MILEPALGKLRDLSEPQYKRLMNTYILGFSIELNGSHKAL